MALSENSDEQKYSQDQKVDSDYDQEPDEMSQTSINEEDEAPTN